MSSNSPLISKIRNYRPGVGLIVLKYCALAGSILPSLDLVPGCPSAAKQTCAEPLGPLGHPVGSIVPPWMTVELSSSSNSFCVVVGFGIVAAVDHGPNLVGGPARFHVLMTTKSINCVKTYQKVHTAIFTRVFSTHKLFGHERYDSTGSFLSSAPQLRSSAVAGWCAHLRQLFRF